MLIRKLVVVGLVGFVTLAATLATAEDAGAPSGVAVDGISFSDPDAPIADRFQFSFDQGRDSGRFFNFGSSPRNTRDNERSYEVSVVARAAAGIDVAFAQRGGVGFNAQGDIESERRGSELRLGSGLGNMRRDQPSSTGRWYIFAASEDEALIWQPGARSDFGSAGSSLALQDRVEIGDMQAGVTYERYGVQASLAYVERQISVSAGNRSIAQDEDFTGLTITMRR